MSIKNSRFKTTSFLIFLYSLQGLIIGLLLETFEIQLKQDFSYQDVGIFLLCSYPFSLKILWSPIVDSYYLKKLGRRKTWIILTQSLAVIILIYLSFNIEQILEEKRIYFFTILSLSLMFLISTQDIAVDGWSLTLCGKENCSLASSCNTIGHIIGIFISTSVYINLKYYKFIEISKYFLILALIFISATVLLLFIDEEEDVENESLSLIETLKRVKKIFVNRNIRKIVGIMIISQLGTTFFSKVFFLVLNEKGLSQEFLTNLYAFLIPIEVFVSYHLSKSNEKLLHNYLFGFCGLILTAICDTILLNFIDNLSFIYLTIIVIILDCFKIWLSLMCFNGISGFFYKICDNKIGATYITALNSINNLSTKWPVFFIFSLVDYFGYKIVAIFSVLYSICFYFYFEKEFKKLDFLEREQWEIKDNESVAQTPDKEK